MTNLQSPPPQESSKLIKGIMDFIGMLNIAIALSVWNGVNQASQDIIRVQEQIAGIKTEIALLRSDTTKNLETHSTDIKTLQQKLARLEVAIPPDPKN